MINSHEFFMPARILASEIKLSDWRPDMKFRDLQNNKIGTLVLGTRRQFYFLVGGKCGHESTVALDQLELVG